MRLEDVDFNAVRALQALLETRSVTLAARRLGTTQPNMSRALARLRELFNDPLFVSTGRALEPTPFALHLEPDVERALWAMRLLFDRGSRSIDADTPPPLRVAASDYGTVVVLRPWLLRAAQERIASSLRVVPLSVGSIGAMQRGELDLALSPRADIDGLEQFVFRPLLRDDYVLVMRPGHPCADAPASLDRYLTAQHVTVENARPGWSAVQRTLTELGHTRQVRVRVPSLLTALVMVAGSDLFVTLPSRIVEACGIPLVTQPLPFRVEPLELHLVFHPRWTSDVHHRLLREGLLDESGASPAL